MRFDFTSWIERPRAAVASLPTLVLSGALALAVSGCSEGDATGLPEEPGNGSEGTGDVTFLIGNSSQASAAVLPRAQASATGAKRPADIESLRMSLSSIEAHMVASASGTPPWIPVDFAPPGPEIVFDPDAPPGDFQPFLEGELPEGEYNMVRLFAEEMWVEFVNPSASGTPITIGNCEFEDTEHAAERPGGNDKPIMVPNVDLSVDAGQNVVVLEWAGSEILASVNVTGNCQVMVRPVLHADGG